MEVISAPASSFALLVSIPPRQELRAGDNGFHQAAEAMAMGREFATHLINEDVIREQQASSERIR
jgi:hypothetical protein